MYLNWHNLNLLFYLALSGRGRALGRPVVAAEAAVGSDSENPWCWGDHHVTNHSSPEAAVGNPGYWEGPAEAGAGRRGRAAVRWRRRRGRRAAAAATWRAVAHGGPGAVLILPPHVRSCLSCCGPLCGILARQLSLLIVTGSWHPLDTYSYFLWQTKKQIFPTMDIHVFSTWYINFELNAIRKS